MPKKIKLSIQFKLSIILAISSVVVYVNTISNGFVLDDSVAISNNSYVVKGIQSIPALLATPYHKGWSPGFHDNLYRPLSLVMFAIEYQISELNPAPYHIINILAFSLCVILLFLFFDSIFNKEKTIVAFIASLLFALHPVHTEVVANIKSRDELLCFLFAFASLNLCLKYMQNGKLRTLFWCSFCFLLSLLSKETSITFIFIIPFIAFAYNSRNKKQNIYIYSAIGITTILYFIARYAIMNYSYSGDFTAISTAENVLADKNLSYASHLATAIFACGYYIKLLFVPHPLICDYSYSSIPLVQFNDPRVWCIIGAYLLLAGFSVYRLIRNLKDPIAFGILFFLVTIALFSNIFFLTGAIFAERFLFFGSAGFCLVIAVLIVKLAGKKATDFLLILKNPKILGIVIPLIIVCSVLTYNRNKDWTDNFVLYTTDISKVPDNCRMNDWVADLIIQTLPEEKDTDLRNNAFNSALYYLNKAVDVSPDFIAAQCDLGNLYFTFQHFDSAETHFMHAYELNPKDILLISNLAHVYYVTKKYREAINYNLKAIDLKPDHAINYANAASCYLNSGDFDSAIIFAKKACALDRSFKGNYTILTAAYKAKGNMDSAQKYEAFIRTDRP